MQFGVCHRGWNPNNAYRKGRESKVISYMAPRRIKPKRVERRGGLDRRQHKENAWGGVFNTGEKSFVKVGNKLVERELLRIDRRHDERRSGKDRREKK